MAFLGSFASTKYTFTQKPLHIGTHQFMLQYWSLMIPYKAFKLFGFCMSNPNVISTWQEGLHKAFMQGILKAYVQWCHIFHLHIRFHQENDSEIAIFVQIHVASPKRSIYTIVCMTNKKTRYRHLSKCHFCHKHGPKYFYKYAFVVLPTFVLLNIQNGRNAHGKHKNTILVL